MTSPPDTPHSRRNLYSSPDHRETREQLKTTLRGLIAELDDPVEAPNLLETLEAIFR